MPAPRTLILAPDDRAALAHALRTDARPYYRERCSALLQLAAGASVRQVAKTGLLQPRRPQTVSGWVDAYEADGLDGLEHAERGARGYPP